MIADKLKHWNPETHLFAFHIELNGKNVLIDRDTKSEVRNIELITVSENRYPFTLGAYVDYQSLIDIHFDGYIDDPKNFKLREMAKFLTNNEVVMDWTTGYYYYNKVGKSMFQKHKPIGYLLVDKKTKKGEYFLNE